MLVSGKKNQTSWQSLSCTAKVFEQGRDMPLLEVWSRPAHIEGKIIGLIETANELHIIEYIVNCIGKLKKHQQVLQ